MQRIQCALRAGFIGRRLCPHLVFVPPTFAKYTAAAAATRAVFARFDPDYEAGSLDEAYLDVTDYCHTHELSGAPGLAAAEPAALCSLTARCMTRQAYGLRRSGSSLSPLLSRCAVDPLNMV